MKSIGKRTWLAALLVGVAAGSQALAQSWPSKPVRMIVPFAPGGIVDVVGRAFAQELTQSFGQQVIVDNRIGANGNIGADACAKAAPDGQTICFMTGVIVSLNPFAYGKLPFDPVRDFVPVVHVSTLNITLAVNASLPVHSVRELLEYAKAKNGAVTWSSLGMGSTAHLYLEWLRAHSGVQFNHIPYKGQPPMVAAAMSGEVDLTMLPPGVVAPLVKKGNLRVIAMMSGDKRLASMPDVATFQEQGFDLDFRNWIGILLQRGTPSEIIQRINADVNKLIGDPKFSGRYMTSLGMTPTGGTVESFAAFLKANRATAASLAKIANLRLD